MRPLPLILAVLLAGCRKDAPPPAPTTEQANQLDAAEAMLNELAANAEAPADRSAGASNEAN